MSKEPHWINACRHDEDAFIGTVICERTLQPIDVYVWKGEDGRYDVCVRFGNEAHEYESSGEVLQYLICPSNRENVKKLILKSGTFTYTKK